MPLDEHQLEQAARQEQADRDGAIAAARSLPAEQALTDATGRRICRGCYDTLSPERLAAAPQAVRCTHCQSLRERWAR